MDGEIAESRLQRDAAKKLSPKPPSNCHSGRWRTSRRSLPFLESSDSPNTESCFWADIAKQGNEFYSHSQTSNASLVIGKFGARHT